MAGVRGPNRLSDEGAQRGRIIPSLTIWGFTPIALQDGIIAFLSVSDLLAVRAIASQCDEITDRILFRLEPGWVTFFECHGSPTMGAAAESTGSAASSSSRNGGSKC